MQDKPITSANPFKYSDWQEEEKKPEKAEWEEWEVQAEWVPCGLGPFVPWLAAEHGATGRLLPTFRQCHTFLRSLHPITWQLIKKWDEKWAKVTQLHT